MIWNFFPWLLETRRKSIRVLHLLNNMPVGFHQALQSEPMLCMIRLLAHPGCFLQC
ncbi:hypothetical protein AGABI1DRAFT_111012 [Agaricus bisporus var. burnettii JB137-S8]|uniref:Uncharacterized protein n=1 Tax=Agaricus bisporus var. burnettii (strain JB137-S8 / ATCC MYA-4627 / FGSC 10392) TaxID=597362 RepID=K5X3E1_AGABU|nr:uncharacterized protein AGABI1DRAFT_111012 [Agaricus bisporus var. burnettii JB137-S8]EKM82366.1 hypothetical protein AGABI1DRAFT_111012 [Agaricus bisporus var. burnettii JB137-S8]